MGKANDDSNGAQMGFQRLSLLFTIGFDYDRITIQLSLGWVHIY